MKKLLTLMRPIVVVLLIVLVAIHGRTQELAGVSVSSAELQGLGWSLMVGITVWALYMLPSLDER
jgi:hypothetical protein